MDRRPSSARTSARTTARPWLTTALLVGWAVAGLGCSSSPTGSAFGQAHRLIDEAERAVHLNRTPQPLPRELSKTYLPKYVLEPGDVLLIEPADFDSEIRLPADQPVQADGTINLGQYGRPVVVGRTVEETAELVEQAVDAKLRADFLEAKRKEQERRRRADAARKAKRTDDFDDDFAELDEPTDADAEADIPTAGPINVRLVQADSKVYYVLGEVNSPGSFPLIGRETVLDAIQVAGGLGKGANTNSIIIARPSPPEGCRAVLPICYEEIVQLGDTTTNYQIKPGDRIFVPSLGLLDRLFPNRAKRCGPCNLPQNLCFVSPNPRCPSCDTCGADCDGSCGTLLGMAGLSPWGPPTPTVAPAGTVYDTSGYTTGEGVYDAGSYDQTVVPQPDVLTLPNR